MSSRQHQAILKNPEKESIFGPERTREQVMNEIKAEPEIFHEFQKLSPQLQEEFLEFSMGIRGLNVTYDPVFRKIFNPASSPERLEDFLSLCMKKKVKILRVLPNESERLTEEGSLLIMDILVQLASGALVNVEIQRLGYLFPGARCACYSSDLLMRQYSQVREQKRKQKKKFSYQDIKGVYTIVLIQKSTKEFHKCPRDYLHYFQQTSNTGLRLDLLQKYLLIPLDIFRKTLQNRDKEEGTSTRNGDGKLKNKLEAWLAFISSDQPEDILEVVRAYPEFLELYREVFEFRYQRKELISMYSKALSILDANTVEYMVEQQKRKLERQRRKLAWQEGELKRQKRELKRQNKVVEQQREVAAQREKENQDLTEKLEKERQEVERLKALLKAKGSVPESIPPLETDGAANL